LPRFFLAHAFPERYTVLEQKMNVEKLSLEQACREVFQLSYHDLGEAIAEFWSLPGSVTRHLRQDPGNDATTDLLRQAGHLAGIMAGERSADGNGLARVEAGLRRQLNDPEFKVVDFIRHTCESDPNVDRFFRLTSLDVERMLRAVERGEAKSEEVAASLTPSTACNPGDKPPEPPAVLIGAYLTELTRLVRRNPDINRVLFTALEAVYRCVSPGVTLLAFPDGSRRHVEGRFLLGLAGRAGDFTADLRDDFSAVTRSMKTRQSGRCSGKTVLPGSWLAQAPLEGVFLAPIVVARSAVGICVVARDAALPFSEQEELWIEAVVANIALGFERAT
jgi:hypothetical protein